MARNKKGNPERVIKRKSYYGFAGKYPGETIYATYLIGDSRKVKRKETVKKFLTVLLLILLFCLAYIITYTALNISQASF
ncbi:MAG: hypothetical protein BWY46_01167 [Firmicutes bacterium ADurb.Bin300]|nr:MAG: hypothetical protein BWY46_01167 [Firmicutes bacterium ADurb.Bin300]